jgi:cytochrome c
VVGSRAGSTDFKRYKGLAGADFVWDEAKLMEFLEDPGAFVVAHTANERSSMAFKLKDARERADVVAYLKTLK